MDKFYGTGKRKESIAKVWLKSGAGNILINNKKVREYLKRESLEEIIKQPFTVTNTVGAYDIHASVSGGGLSGQCGALRLGISRALLEINPNHRLPLKRAGFLTRDSRIVERKKYGQPGARKRFQFSKR